jgi:serine/threonine-protein kinase RsbW
MAHDTITLTVPARPEYAKAVRMTASALVSRSGLSYDEVDDVRIAAEEAFVYAADHATDSGTVSMEFDKSPEHFEIRVLLGNGDRITTEDAERRAAYATFILQSVCDRFEMSSDETGTHLRVVKNLPTESDDAVS